MTSEARQYAQRNQQGSDWFCHERPAETAAAPIATAAAECTSENFETQPKDLEVEKLNEPEPEEVTAAKDEDPMIVASTQAQMIRPKCDSNQW